MSELSWQQRELQRTIDWLEILALDPVFDQAAYEQILRSTAELRKLLTPAEPCA